MPGETSLPTLLQTLKVTLLPTIYVFATIPSSHLSTPLLSDIPISEIRMFFVEAEGTTLIIPLALAQKLESQQHLDFKASYRCQMITLDVHSSLEAVGFMAAITKRISEEGISVNPVSGFYHDHLFVREEEVERAVGVLERLALESGDVEGLGGGDGDGDGDGDATG